jgi:hypothetical protein
MASITRTRISQEAASKFADVWEARITRLIEENDATTFQQSQQELYKDLVRSLYFLIITP